MEPHHNLRIPLWRLGATERRCSDVWPAFSLAVPVYRGSFENPEMMWDVSGGFTVRQHLLKLRQGVSMKLCAQELVRDHAKGPTIVRIPKKAAIALLAGISIAGIAGASAATLGTLTSTSLGSGDSVVAACDTDGIGISYTTAYSASAQKYQVSAVNFSGVNPACTTKAASVSLRNGTTELQTTSVGSITVATTSFSITLGTPVEAALVNGTSLIISG